MVTFSFSLGSRKLLSAAIIVLCVSSALRAQGLGSEALTFFPANTQQVAFADLSQLRNLPDYKSLRQTLFSQEMRNLEGLLQSMGNDPEQDVDEVILGWRANAMSVSDAFGLAEGTFNPAQIQNSPTGGNLRSRQYSGYTLVEYGSGERNGVFFTYVSSDLAAFGRLGDLERLIDDYLGKESGLNSNSDFANWEAELEGSGAQWGITTGAAAAIMAAPWLGVNSKSEAGTLSSFFKAVKAVLYKVNWSGDFDAQISAICDNSQDAATLERLLLLGQNALPATAGASAAVQQFVRGLQISADGSRLELEGSGPPQLITELLGNGRK
jgi:hypothetical protein